MNVILFSTFSHGEIAGTYKDNIKNLHRNGYIQVTISIHMVDPSSLMYWVDNWREANPGEVGGKKLKLIAIQHARRIRNLWRKRPKNFIYRIGKTREIVYKRYSKSPAVMKMGISIKRLGSHPYSVSMEEYARYFIDKSDQDWLERNNYELV